MLGREIGVFYSGDQDSIISSSKIKEYIYCRSYDSSYVFLQLRINDFLICCGSQWYTFNPFLQSQDRQEKKILHYFHTLCELIYVKVTEFFSPVIQEIDLFCDESISDCVVLTVKFGDDNDCLSESHVGYVKEGLDSVYQDRFICELFEMSMQLKFDNTIKFRDGGFVYL